MTQFDVFRYIGGPQIDTNLFANNVSAGINAGNKLPTNFTAGVQGLVQGIGQGQQIIQNDQEIDIRQNQIDQQPVANALQETQLKNAQTVEQLNALKLQTEQDTQSLQLENAKAKLEAETVEAKTKLADSNTLRELQKQLSVNPTQALADIQNGEIAAVLIRNPDSAAQILAGMDAAGLPKDAYAGLKAAVNGAAERKLELERQSATIKSRQNVAAEREKDYSNAEYNLAAITHGKVPADYDPRGFKAIQQDNPTDPTKKDLYLDYNGERIKDFSSTEEMNRVMKDVQEVTAWKVAHNLLPTPTVAPKAPTEPGKASSIATFNNAAQPTPTPPAGAAIAPQNLQDNIPIKSEDAVTQQARNDLLRRAQTDASIKERLIAKGLLKEGIVKPAPTPGAAVPTTSPTPQAQVPPSAAPTPSVPVSVSTATPAPAATIEAVHAALPAPAKKFVEVATVKKVSANPDLKGLTPLELSVVSVESAGVANARPKNFDNKRISAEGYFQLTRGAAQDTKVDKSIPSENIEGGVNYLNRLLKRYNDNEPVALMAYNLGMGVIDSAISISGSSNYSDVVDSLEYMYSRGMYADFLTKKNLDIVRKYPLKVLAYKQVYQSI